MCSACRIAGGGKMHRRIPMRHRCCPFRCGFRGLWLSFTRRTTATPGLARIGFDVLIPGNTHQTKKERPGASKVFFQEMKRTREKSTTFGKRCVQRSFHIFFQVCKQSISHSEKFTFLGPHALHTMGALEKPTLVAVHPFLRWAPNPLGAKTINASPAGRNQRPCRSG